MAIDPFTLATELSVLIGARDPQWKVQANNPLLAPASDADGVYLDNAVRALLTVQMRELTHCRTARLTIPSLTIGNTFTVTINATAVAYNSTGDANLDEVVDGIAAAIEANGTVGPLVSAVAVRGSDDAVTPGVRDSVRIRGVAYDEFSIDFSDNGASTVAVVADPVTADVNVFYTLRGATGSSPPSGWRRHGTVYTVTRGGLVEPLVVSGRNRAAVFFAAVGKQGSDGSVVTVRTPTFAVGPCVLEA